MDPAGEKRILEEALGKALDEAWSKAYLALQQVDRSAEGREKAVWLAAESADYASLLFSLTNDLEDVFPAVSSNQEREILSLVKESAEALTRVRKSPSKDKAVDYGSLRQVVQNLWNAYFGLAKKPGRRGRT